MKKTIANVRNTIFGKEDLASVTFKNMFLQYIKYTESLYKEQVSNFIYVERKKRVLTTLSITKIRSITVSMTDE
jgi:hypothetical protein